MRTAKHATRLASDCRAIQIMWFSALSPRNTFANGSAHTHNFAPIKPFPWAPLLTTRASAARHFDETRRSGSLRFEHGFQMRLNAQSGLESRFSPKPHKPRGLAMRCQNGIRTRLVRESSEVLANKGGSPAWIRTTITLNNGESVSCRLFKGLECRIGPENPALVHNSYTESRPGTTGVKPAAAVRFHRVSTDPIIPELNCEAVISFRRRRVQPKLSFIAAFSRV